MNSYELDEIFQILGIERTKDKKEIKKAYSNLVKTIHPEEKQEEWAKLYDAYKKAILWADDKVTLSQLVYEDQQPEVMEQQKEHYLDWQEEVEKNLEKVSQYLESFIECGHVTYSEWEEFFKSKEYMSIRFRQDFIELFEKNMYQMKINIQSRDLILSELDLVWKEWAALEFFSSEIQKRKMESFIKRIKHSVKYACHKSGNGNVIKFVGVIFKVIAAMSALFSLIGLINAFIEEPETEATKMDRFAKIAAINDYNIFMRNIKVVNEEGSDISLQYEYHQEEIPNEISIALDDDLKERTAVAFSVYSDNLRKEEYGQKMVLLSYSSFDPLLKECSIYVYEGNQYIELKLAEWNDDNIQSLPYGSYYSNNGTFIFKTILYEKDNMYPIVMIEESPTMIDTGA